MVKYFLGNRSIFYEMGSFGHKLSHEIWAHVEGSIVIETLQMIVSNPYPPAEGLGATLL